MAATTPAKRLKILTSQIPDDPTVCQHLSELVSRNDTWSDHLIAVVGATYVEKALEVAIKTKFVSLTKPEEDTMFSYQKRGPLSDFSAKIKIAYALDIVGPQTRNDLEGVRSIRNAFAHSLHPINFDTPEIAELCDVLFTYKDVGLLGGIVSGGAPRAKYVNTTLTIGMRLKNGIQEIMLMFLGRAVPRRPLP